MREADFSGYATRAGIKCSDGRTIMPEAFQKCDGATVPLVWQHGHDAPANVLGHAVLEARADGVYAYAYFNESKPAQNAKLLVQHKDITALSIYANQLVERSKQVFHGVIRELSLVLSAANPGAFIDNISLSHGDDVTVLDDEAIIYTGLSLEHENQPGVSADASDKVDETETLQHIYDNMSEKERNLVQYMIGEALTLAQSGDVSHSDESEVVEDAEESVESDTEDTEEADADSEHETDEASADSENKTDEAPADSEDEDNLAHQEGTDTMSRNVFEQNGVKTEGPTLSHAQIKTIVDDAEALGSFKESFFKHAVEYGIENIDFLFPDAKNLTSSPELVTRRQEWVSKVLNGTKKSPFSRIKTMSADLTLDEARAKGYVKGHLKKEEWFKLTKRITIPTTIYKKQKLDRDDIVDITDLDVVVWLKGEMRLMLDEEIARAALVGDGREVDDEDKVNETCIRPIAFEDDFYAHKIIIPANLTGDAVVEAVLRARPFYRGLGQPTFFTTEALLTDMLLVKDKMGRRLYTSESELAFTLRAKEIVVVPVMESLTTDGGDLVGILVNLSDYTMGADKGGNIAMFDDFDIDYNQYKYLIETRMSGALTGFKTAIVFTRAAGTKVTPTVPTFVPATGVLTVPAVTGVTYQVDGVNVSAGAQTAIAKGASISVAAVANSGFYFPHNFDADWDFTRDAV